MFASLSLYPCLTHFDEFIFPVICTRKNSGGSDGGRCVVKKQNKKLPSLDYRIPSNNPSQIVDPKEGKKTWDKKKKSSTICVCTAPPCLVGDFC